MPFKLRRLSVRGASVEDANLTFKDGLNVITGPSNTGKSYVFECINYMLGSSAPPKSIKQAKGYSTIFLEIQTTDAQTYTLESDLKGGSFKLYNLGIDNIHDGLKAKVLNRKSRADEEDTISSFLLSLINLEGKKVRKNARGDKIALSYRHIAKLILIDENKIISKGSPFLSGQYVTRTEEENILKFLVTGQDDSNIVGHLSKEQVTHRKGKIELLSNLIEQTLVDISIYPNEEDVDNRLIKLQANIQAFSNQHSKLKSSFLKLDSKRKELASKLSSESSQVLYYSEILSRSKILKDQYESDIGRLRATIEVSQLLLSGHTNNAQCPVCKSQFQQYCNNDDVLQVIKSCELEILKISMLNDELLESENLIRKQQEDIIAKISEIKVDIDSISDELDNNVSAHLSDTIQQINELNATRQNLYELSFLKRKLKDLTEQKLKIESSLDNSVSQFRGLSTSILEELAQSMKNVLIGCKYPDLTTVSYSEEKKDFVISGEDRELFGKGYRAITYAAFVIALQELLISKSYSIGSPVLDSPFVTYKRASGNMAEAIPLDLAMNFYRYVSTGSYLPQVIIIENEEPPSDIESKINHVKFTGVDGNGRYGFFPVALMN